MTATISSGHLFRVDQVILIAGADQAAYNGEQRITNVTANSFTFEIEDASTQPKTPATGTISVKVAPLGFETVFTANNKRAYRSTNPQSSRPFLRVDNSLDPLWTSTFAKYAKVTLAENMTDIDTFTGARAFYDPLNPTRNEVATGKGELCYNGLLKWIYARGDGGYANNDGGTGTRHWTLIGDDRCFYLFNTTTAQGNYGFTGYFFGDIVSFKQGDAYGSLLIAHEDYYHATGSSFYPGYTFFSTPHQYTGKFFLKDYTQLGYPIRAAAITVACNTSTGYASAMNAHVPFPNGPDFSLIFYPVYLKQIDDHIRGLAPGWYYTPQLRPLSNLAVVSDVANYPNRKFMLVDVADSNSGATQTARVVFDVTGPWR